jgi:hypothetical protein
MGYFYPPGSTQPRFKCAHPLPKLVEWGEKFLIAYYRDIRDGNCSGCVSLAEYNRGSKRVIITLIKGQRLRTISIDPRRARIGQPICLTNHV